ncbi:MAG: FecR family protein [Tannerellaceae bacterium]|jgi:ferric-dicitrate binding protein FerR (iron transport regulator)|nr:FecR family protein [Tannerellaceae bacterium]
MNRLYECITKFLSDERLTNDEFAILSKLLNDTYNQQIMVDWLKENWQNSQPETVMLEFEQIRRNIKVPYLNVKVKRFFSTLSKVSAILFIPLFSTVLYFYFSQYSSNDLLILSTQKGEQASVILPDGSKVWLNADTKLYYPVDFGMKSRNIELEGEAYFEVKKNEKLPFNVTSGNVTTKAIGTQFIISAYPEQSQIKSSLINGIVEIEYDQTRTILKVGQQLVYHKNKSCINILPFEEKYELAWKNNQLIFRLTPFSEVITELEKWYNIDIKYNPELFKVETLTVRFEHYETLEHVLQVIAKAHDFKYSIKDRSIIITK